MTVLNPKHLQSQVGLNRSNRVNRAVLHKDCIAHTAQGRDEDEDEDGENGKERI